MSTFRRLREEEDFVDVTLACSGRRNFTAHKVVLSACSPYFKQLLKVSECEQVTQVESLRAIVQVKRSQAINAFCITHNDLCTHRFIVLNGMELFEVLRSANQKSWLRPTANQNGKTFSKLRIFREMGDYGNMPKSQTTLDYVTG